MNIKLSSTDYQNMIIELISQNIQNIGRLRVESGNVDWIYFIERLRQKGVHGDIRPIHENIQPKSKHIARTIARRFEKGDDVDITTVI